MYSHDTYPWLKLAMSLGSWITAAWCHVRASVILNIGHRGSIDQKLSPKQRRIRSCVIPIHFQGAIIPVKRDSTMLFGCSRSNQADAFRGEWVV